MTTSSIRFQPGGPAGVGLEAWGAKPAASLERGEAVQHGHMYFEDEALGLSAGIWDCTPFVGKPRAHGCNEFMILLEGSVTIRPESGPATTVRAGQSFFLPKGLRMQWEQPERVRKYFVIYDGPVDAPAPAEAPALIVDPAVTLGPSTPPAASTLFGPVPTQAGKAAFADTTGQWTVGVWETTAYHRRPVPFPRYELMHVLEGGVTVRGADGEARQYGPGDTFFISKGMVGDFEVADRLRKIYCIMIPKAAA